MAPTYDSDMSHARLAYYSIVALIGSVTLAISTFGVIRARVRSYRFLVLFYAGFTLHVLIIFAREYMYLNVDDYSLSAIFATYAVGSILNPAFLVLVGMFLQRLSSVRAARLRDALLIIAGLFVASAYFLPGSVTLDADSASLRFGPIIGVSNVLYLAMLAYMVGMSVAGASRDRPIRELVLLWSLALFGAVGFIETMINVVVTASQPMVVLAPAAGDLLVSTVPYVFFAVVLIYYFGSYLLAEARPVGTLSGSFVEQYGISPREQEVVLLINQGLSNREIAEKLFVSVATVKTHAHNIYEKTGAKSRYDLFHLVR